MDGVPDRLHPAEGLLREGRAAGLRKGADRHRPVLVDAYEGNAYLRLKANPKYWGGKPAFETVVFKFVPDATSRVAEIESGSSDVTLEVPYEEFDRLRGKAGLKGEITPISDIAQIFITNGGVMDDKNVRLALIHAVDKEAIVKRLLRGYGVPIATLEAPEYAAFDPSIKVAYDPLWRRSSCGERLFQGKAGQVHHPNDARFQAEGLRDRPGDRRDVAQCRHRGRHRDLRNRQALRTAHVAQAGAGGVLQLGNAIGDPTCSTGFAMFSKSPHSAWHSDDLDAKIGPLWGEKDEKKRIDGWKAVDRYIAEQGYILPLLQYAQPVLYKSDLKVTPNVSGALQPTLVSK